MKLKDLEASEMFVFQRDLEITPDLMDNHILTLSRVMRVLEVVTEGLGNKPYPKVFTIANGGSMAFPVDEKNEEDEVVRVTSLDLKDAVTRRLYERTCCL